MPIIKQSKNYMKSKRITAVEASDISKRAKEIDLSFIYDSIRQVAGNGSNNVAIPLEGKLAQFVDNVIVRLKQDGFKVCRDRGGDMRDSWDNLVIRWD